MQLHSQERRNRNGDVVNSLPSSISQSNGHSALKCISKMASTRPVNGKMRSVGDDIEYHFKNFKIN